MRTVSFVRGKGRLFAGAGLAALALTAAPVLAQDVVDPDEDEEEGFEEPSDDDIIGIDEEDPTTADAGGPAQGQAIIVTGSRIPRPNLDSTVPITAVDAGELLNDGAVSLGDALNDLPSLRSTFSSSNSQRFIGTTGLNILDLRGLGTARTLTLVNGRRHVTASAGSFQVDVNTIPFSLLERVDVVTGGSSAVYGSDAIAGVVNFVLKRDFDGIELDGQAGLAEGGDNARYSIEGTIGRNFADGRGNIALAAEYTRIAPTFNTQRPEISGAFGGFTAFQFVEDRTDDGFDNDDGIPDREIRNNLVLNFISDGGTFNGICLTNAAVQPLACDANGNDVAFRFGANGRLAREDGIIDDFRQFGSSRTIGGGGSNLSNTGTLFPEIERINVNLLGRFDVSDAFRPYAEFKYARIDAEGSSTPSFFNGFCGGLGGAVGLDTSCFDDFASANYFITFDNAFLNPQDAEQIRAVQNELLAVFDVPPIASGFTLARNNVDFGARTDTIERETYRAVVGVEGDIASNTRYDLSVTYGKFESTLDASNNLIIPNARRAIDAVFDDSGNIVCRVNADADPSNDDPACVPLNPFGFGAPSQAALDYVQGSAQLFEDAEQFDVLGFVSTDSSPFFELPGGPIALLAGFEYRRETASLRPDDLSATGTTFFNAFDEFDPPTLELIEGFGEIQVPLLAGMPFAEELTFSAAGRISDYNSGGGETGTVESYNLNLLYAPIPDIRFRANYSRAVRAPNPSDLFFPPTQNFVFFDDPCDNNFINQNPQRLANCRAAGVPVGFDADARPGNVGVSQGGNPLLEAELSDSYTIGAILEPRFLPGFSLTVDYYDIEVESVIANISAQQILLNCFDAPDLTNNFCDLINPRDADGFLDQQNALNIAPVNFAKLTAEGIDFDAQYERTFDNDDRLSLRLIATHVLDRTNFLDVDNPDEPNVVKGELGDPEWSAVFNASYRRGDATLSYSLRWIDEQFIGTFETTNPFLDACPNNGIIPRTGPDAASSETCTPGAIVEVPALNPDDTAEVVYPDVFYHDIRLDFRVDDEFNFYLGVDNVGDRLPPFGLTGLGGGDGIFDNIGRFFYAGFNAEF